LLASGQVDSKGNDDDSIPCEEVAWTFMNCKGTRKVGTAGTPFIESAPPVSGSGNPNGAGLFDMAGNVLEFCWDWFGPYAEVKKGTFYAGPSVGSSRVMRGGSWYPFTISAAAGERYFYDANEAYNYFGFRVVATR
jgi:formylglycine-generating enzyme required for sulfatase activity